MSDISSKILPDVIFSSHSQWNMFIFHEMILIWYVCLLKALHCFFIQQFANNKSLSVFYAKRMCELQRGGDKRNAPFFHSLYIELLLWPTRTTWHSDSIHWCIKFVDGHPLLRCLLFHTFAWENISSHLIAATKSWS